MSVAEGEQMQLYSNATAGREFSSACLHVFKHSEKQFEIAGQKLLLLLLLVCSEQCCKLCALQNVHMHERNLNKESVFLSFVSQPCSTAVLLLQSCRWAIPEGAPRFIA